MQKPGAIRYVLHRPSAHDRGCAVICIEVAGGSRRQWVLDLLLELAAEEEKEGLRRLAREELLWSGRSQGADTLPMGRTHVDPKRLWELVVCLAKTERLFFQGRRLVGHEDRVVDLLFEVQREAQQVHLEVLFQIGGARVGRSQVELFYGPPIWLVHEGGIYPLRPRVQRDWIEKPSLERCVGVCVIEKPSVSVSPLPVLVLRDRLGMQVALWMDYNGNRVPFSGKAQECAWERDLLEAGYRKGPLGYDSSSTTAGDKLALLLQIGWKLLDVQGREVLVADSERVHLSCTGDQILVEGEVGFGAISAPLSRVLQALQNGQSWLELGPTQVGLLAPGPQVKELIKLQLPSLSLPRSHFALLREGTWDTTAPLRQLMGGIEPASLGSEFVGTLHAYQQEGVNWLVHLQERGLHALLADEMGLGKTVQLLAFLSRRMPEGPILIVAPTSLLFHWHREIERFLPTFSAYLHHGMHRERCLHEHSITITSYALLRRDASLLLEREYAVVILDEAQMIKNAESQGARCTHKLKAKMRIALTGTPMENRWEDLWSLFHFLMPELLGPVARFQREIASSAASIRKRVRPFLLRRRKEEVLDQLPAKVEQLVWVEMGDAQRQMYEALLSLGGGALRAHIAQRGLGASRMQILELILRLRQVACHPWLVDPGMEGQAVELSGKLSCVLSDLESLVAEGRKVLVYSQFVQMLQLIAKELQARSWRYAYLDGSTRDREGAVRQFQEDPETPLFLVSLKAGGVGLNLTAADYVLLFDPWWNPAVEAQAIDRAHRLGRKGQVIARRYVTAMSVEEKMMQLKEKKATLLAEMWEAEEGTTLEELMDLIDLPGEAPRWLPSSSALPPQSRLS